MPQRPAIEHAIAVAEQVTDREDLAWLARGFALALRTGSSLELTLGLPASPSRRRKALRDYWLEMAVAQLGDAPPWVKAREIEREGRDFAAQLWPRWQELATPPLEASSLEQALFHLHRAGGRVPKRRRLYDLVTAIVDPEIAVGSGLACGIRDTEACDAIDPA